MKILIDVLARWHRLYWYELKIIILTWRKHKDYFDITFQWLKDNEIPFDKIHMQPWSTAEKNHIFKGKALKKLQETYDIIAMFDDNPDMIPVCKELWIPLLHVNI